LIRKILWLGAIAVAAVIASESVIADHLWFQFRKASYLSELGTRDLALFRWSEHGALGGGVSFKGVLFDQSGEIMLPASGRTSEWTANFLKECSTSVICGLVEESPDWQSSAMAFGGHFYLLKLNDR
jgi:hypothetical protein